MDVDGFIRTFLRNFQPNGHDGDNGPRISIKMILSANALQNWLAGSNG